MKEFVSRSRADCEKLLLGRDAAAGVTPEHHGPQSEGCRRNLEASFSARGDADSSSRRSCDDQAREQKVADLKTEIASLEQEDQLAAKSYERGGPPSAARNSDIAPVSLTSSLCLSPAVEMGVCRGDRACIKEMVFKTPEQLRHALFPNPERRMAPSGLACAVVPERLWASALCPTPERPWQPTWRVNVTDSSTGPVGVPSSSEMQHPRHEPEHEIAELRHHIVGLVLARAADAAETTSLRVQLLRFKQFSRRARLLLLVWRELIEVERHELILSRLERRAGRERSRAAFAKWRRRARTGREVAGRVEATKTRAAAACLQLWREMVTESSAR